MIGIYRIRNTKNGKIYIGQSVNITHRWACHLYDLRNNRHANLHLQRAYNIDPDSLVFEIVCQCEEKDLNDIEAALIKNTIQQTISLDIIFLMVAMDMVLWLKAQKLSCLLQRWEINICVA